MVGHGSVPIRVLPRTAHELPDWVSMTVHKYRVGKVKIGTLVSWLPHEWGCVKSGDSRGPDSKSDVFSWGPPPSVLAKRSSNWLEDWLSYKRLVCYGFGTVFVQYELVRHIF